MKINDLEKILPFKQKWRAEKAVGFAIKTDVWDAIQAIKKECGPNVQEWPEHWVSLLKESPQPEQIDGGAAEKSGAPKQATKFADLTEEDKEFIRSVYVKDATVREKFNLMFDRFGIESRTTGEWYNKLGLIKKEDEIPDYIKAARSRDLPNRKTLVFTCAQNATKVHEKAFKSMMTYARVRDASVHIIPFSYKNPTSVNVDIPYQHWDPLTIPFLDETRHYLAENLLVCSDIKIQSTNPRPLNGLQALTGGATSIIAHPRLHLVSTPVLEGSHRQTLWTTGAITVENYTKTLTGSKGQSHHSLAFLVVEIDGDGSDDNFFLRHVSICDDGSLQDLNLVIDGDEVSYDGKITTCRWGDLHSGFEDPNKVASSIDLCNWLSPEYVILDDVFDGSSGLLNHHEQKDKVSIYHNMKAGKYSIQKEVEDMVNLVKHIADNVPMAEIVVVASNHDRRLDRFVREQDWRSDPFNADFLTHCLGISLANPDIIGLVPYFLESALGERVRCLGLNDSFKPDGSEHAMHGHIGTSGSRGSLSQASRLSTKVTQNHDHTSGRIDGAMSAGSSTHLRLSYTNGPSCWRHGDIIGYPNGKRANILYNSKYKFTTWKFNI